MSFMTKIIKRSLKLLRKQRREASTNGPSHVPDYLVMICPAAKS